MRIPEPIKAPTKKEHYVLRFMILAGLAAMGYLLYNLLNSSIIDNPLLYWLLIIALSFTCLKILHEWYHYFYIIVPVKPPLNQQFTVDILTTYCPGEPYEMMLETLTAIQNITYPHTTYLCDEADDPYLKNLCRELNIHHITRFEKVNAKAGNINNALQYASGELCVVLDPDHVPLPNFLDPIVSHFNNPKVGFVQIVQAYKNFHESLIAKGAAQQTFQFYGPMMMTMNKYGTVLAIGANCTFRRAALDSIGGHAAGLAEDMHTAMQLHAKGWQSVYVPEVLARGLVPSTLSAYYSQQLKWSRGVFELLVTSYPRLFKSLTWRQKLHYGIIPFYYFSGIIFLINFSIPILSLLFEVNPIKMDFDTFALIGFPLIIQIILIRNYVQRWVMEDEERGFHIVGGLLMIGTWWIYIVGLLYTIIRKKVPYVPTPKDGNEENNWRLNIPNLIVLFITLFAIVYGLYTDWNPYTIVMAGIAGINCIIILFNIIASKQLAFRKIKHRSIVISATARHAFNARQLFWKMRIKAYAGIRSIAFFLTVLSIGITIYMIQARSSNQLESSTPVKKKDTFLMGIFAPESTDGLSSVRLVQGYNVPFDIISLYIPWGSKDNSNLPLSLVDSIYNNGSIPMITWEPWQNLFDPSYGLRKDEKVFERITEGDYDAYISKFAQQIQRLNRPVYIRFAHEADNPLYPWSATGANTPDEFKKAWKYVHDIFRKENAFNAIWVWNPWKPEAVKDYFPGRNYIDWIGITNLNYGSTGPDKTWYSMEELYSPFHKQPILRSGIPVMLAEMGSLRSEGRQSEWFKNAVKAVKYKFPEIKAFVLFNSGLDKNVPVDTNIRYLDWRISNPQIILATNTTRTTEKRIPFLDVNSNIKLTRTAKADKINVPKFDTIIGVNYSKGLNWLKNYNTLRHKEIKGDFSEIKNLGFNTIRRYGPDIYDDSILETAKQNDLKINYGFYVPDDIDFIEDTKTLNNLDKIILSTVKKFKDNQTIIAWSIGNTPLQKLSSFYNAPDLTYQKYAYASWLKQLIMKIKFEDPSRPVTVDVEVSSSLAQTIAFVKHKVPQLDAFGFVINDQKEMLNLDKFNSPYFISSISAVNYIASSVKHSGIFIADWQDQQRENLVTFDGLKDNWGRNKVTLYQLRNKLKNTSIGNTLPNVKILKPAASIYANKRYKYHALVNVNNEWKLAHDHKPILKYSWYLVKTDRYGNGLSMKYISTGASVSLLAPINHQRYQLYLNASSGNDVTTARSRLNIPLIVNPGGNIN